MAREKRITVKLTTKEWNALYSCSKGELESLSAYDQQSGEGKDLASAQKQLIAGRKNRAVAK